MDVLGEIAAWVLLVGPLVAIAAITILRYLDEQRGPGKKGSIRDIVDYIAVWIIFLPGIAMVVAIFAFVIWLLVG